MPVCGGDTTPLLYVVLIAIALGLSSVTSFKTDAGASANPVSLVHVDECRVQPIVPTFRFPSMVQNSLIVTSRVFFDSLAG